MKESIEDIVMSRIDLGCGAFKKQGYLGFDNMEAAEYQGMTEDDREWIVVWDLNKGIPVTNNSITDIYMSHFIEHVRSPVFLLYECYRVCVHGAHIEMYVPLHEMESAGHITEFDEGWFERKFLEEFQGMFSIIHKSVQRGKLSQILTKDGQVKWKTFDELNLIIKVVK
jgi:predicted SAM-dependent methyltransferase